MDDDEDTRKGKIIACSACRLAKRKCDGRIPCGCCIKRGEDILCTRTLAKKRGRPRRDTMVLQIEGNVIPTPTCRFSKLDPRQSLLLSLLISGNCETIIARPRDFAMGFGFKLAPNTLLIKFPDTSHIQSAIELQDVGLFAATLQGAPVVGQLTDDSVPELRNVSFVGRRLDEVIDVFHSQQCKMAAIELSKRVPEIHNFSGTGAARFISFRVPIQKRLYVGVDCELKFFAEPILCIDERGFPKFIFLGMCGFERVNVPDVTVEEELDRQIMAEGAWCDLDEGQWKEFMGDVLPIFDGF